MFKFEFLKKGLGTVFLPYFVHDLSRKLFVMLHFINKLKFIARFPLLLEILNNMCIAIAGVPGCDVIILKINLIFLIKPFLFMTEKSRKKLKNLENEKRF